MDEKNQNQRERFYVPGGYVLLSDVQKEQEIELPPDEFEMAASRQDRELTLGEQHRLEQLALNAGYIARNGSTEKSVKHLYHGAKFSRNH